MTAATVTPAPQVASSNSHLAAKNGRPSAVEVGIDTWRIVRYLDDDRELRKACVRVGPAGILPEKVAGHRVGVLPAHRMLWAEGHPAVEGLAPPATLHEAEERLLDALADAGLPVGRAGGIGRLDQTVTLEFDDPREGLCFMAGIAAVDVPRVKPAVYGRPPETVYFLAERSGRKLARVYDKGAESNTAPPGRLVRLENQSRFGKEARMSSETISSSQVSESLFKARFAPVAASCDGLTAATLPLLAERVADKVADGKMTYRQAERLIGFLVLKGQKAPRYAPRTERRRMAELREHGLVLADPLTDPIEVDLADGIEEALAAWTRDA